MTRRTQAVGRVLAGLGLALGLVASAPHFALAQTATVDDGVYVMTSEASEKAVASASSNRRSGTNVQTWADTSVLGQRWLLQRSGEHYVVRSASTNLVLDVYGAGRSNGTNVQLWQANGTNAQLWDLVANDDGSYSLQSFCNGLVLDVSGAGRSNGTNIQVWQSNGTKAQRFRLSPTKSVGSGTYTVRSQVNKAKVLDVPSASTANGTRIQLWDANGSAAQKWSLSYDAQTGYYTMSAACSGKSVDVPAANATLGARLQQYQANGSNAQLWDVRQNEDGSYTVRTALNGRALDVPSANAYNGAAVQLYDSNGSNAQRWVLEKTSLVADGLYTVTSSVDGSKALDVSSASMSPDARIQVWSSNRTLAQKWLVSYDANAGGCRIRSANSGLCLTDAGGTLKGTSAPDGAALWTATLGANGGVTFVNASTGRALDLAGASAKDGNSVGTYAANGTAAQSWRLTAAAPIEEGTYVLSTYTNQALGLDVSGASKANGAAVQVYQKNGTAAQVWTVKSAGNGLYSLTNGGSGKALDVPSGRATAGALLQQYTSNGTKAQLWKTSIAQNGGVVFTSTLSDGLALGVPSDGTRIALVDGSSDGARWAYAQTTPVKNAGSSSNGGSSSSAGSVSGTDSGNLKYDSAYLNQMRAKAVQKGSDTNYYVTVDIDQAHVVVFQRSNGSWHAVKTFDVTTGAYGGKWGRGTNNSKSGLFKVHHKAPALYQNANGSWATDVNGYWTCFVTAWSGSSSAGIGSFKLPSYPQSRGTSTPYELGQGFHYSIYPSMGYKHKGSGCICMNKADAKWIYDNVPESSTVESFASYNSNPTSWSLGNWPK